MNPKRRGMKPSLAIPAKELPTLPSLWATHFPNRGTQMQPSASAQPLQEMPFALQRPSSATPGTSTLQLLPNPAKSQKILVVLIKITTKVFYFVSSMLRGDSGSTSTPNPSHKKGVPHSGLGAAA